MEKTQRAKFFFSALFSLLCILFAAFAKLLFYSYIRLHGPRLDLLLIYVIIILVAYPSLAYLSDVWSRKAMLLITLLTMVAGLIFMYFEQAILATVLISISPVVSIGRAAFCDTHMTNNRGPNILDTFIVQAIPWILSPNITHGVSKYILLNITFGVILFLVSIFFKDIKNRHILFKNFGALEAIKVYGLRTCLIIPITFFLTNMSWSMLFYKKSAFVEKDFFSLAGIAFCSGIFLMRLVVRRKKIFFIENVKKEMLTLENDNYIKLLIYVSIGIVPFYLLINFAHIFFNRFAPEHIFEMSIFLTFFGGMFIPLIYTFFGGRVSFHALGSIYAVLEIIQTLSELVGELTLSLIKTDVFISISTIFLTGVSLAILSRLTFKKESHAS